MKKSLILLALALSALATAETWVIPHVLEKDGRVMGTVFNASGSHEKLDTILNVIRREPVSFIPSSSVPLLQDLLPQSSDHLSTGKELTIYRQDFGPVQPNKHRTIGPRPVGIKFPACDANSKDPAYMVLKFEGDDTSLEHVDSVPAPPRQKDKPFLMSAYQIALNGQLLPDATMEPLEFKVKETVKSDGSPVKALDANPILRVGGQPLSPRLRIGSVARLSVAYGSHDGTAIFLTSECIVTACSGQDLFSPFGSPTVVELTTIRWALEVRVGQIKMA